MFRFSISVAATILGALIGAGLCADRMPDALDWVYKTVKATSAKPPTTEVVEGPTVIHTKTGNKQVTPATPETVSPTDNYQWGRSIWGRLSLGLLGVIVGGAIGSAIGRVLERWFLDWEKMPLGERVTIITGVLIGVLVTIALSPIVTGTGLAYGPVVIGGLMLGLSALGIFALKSIEEALPWHRASGNRRRSGIKVLDTNVLIDGRIYDVIRAGFLEGDLYVPQFVIQELQHIADSSDSNRRQRGRRGLDVLKRIQSERTVDVGSQDRFAGDAKELVDDRLVKLAKAVGGDLVSNDFNLNKVATIQEVRVLNINDLVVSLKPTVLPGEALDITILRLGNQPGQGVGYLDDGTMVVVEHGSELVGNQIKVEVTQVIQTERGKMIFADATPFALDDRLPKRSARGRATS